jgi:DNA-binding LytR/AlgR family response regulator
MKYTALIVDDEPHARAYLVELVSQNKSLELCGTCNTGNEALEFCQTLQPDIIFLDIQMPGKGGIETAKAMMHKNCTSVIIFTTAYDQYAIQAFEVEAIGYLLKPFSTEQFTHTIKRAIALKESTKRVQFDQRMNQVFQRYNQASTNSINEFIIHEKGLEIRVTTDEIIYIISDSEYVSLHVKSRKYLKRLNLKMLARQLPSSFLRIHRSTIINRAHVHKWNYLNNGTYSFDFDNEVTLKSSRSYQQVIQQVLTNHPKGKTNHSPDS